MKVSFHKLVQRDFDEAISFYRRVASKKKAEEFEANFREGIQRAAAHPTRFHFGLRGLRRTNLEVFPCLFLYRVRTTGILITVLRHDKRHPNYGLNRE